MFLKQQQICIISIIHIIFHQLFLYFYGALDIRGVPNIIVLHNVTFVIITNVMSTSCLSAYELS